MPLLEVRDLKTRYNTAAGPVRAVDGVSFEVDRGQAFGISGESGCGKSTVALSLMGLIKGGKVVSGSVTLEGRSLLDLTRNELNRVRWKKISMIAQAAMGALNPVHSIGHQIVEAIRTHETVKRPQAMHKARALLSQVDIDPARVVNFPHELSGGMRQRAMIAMALALNPQVVLADEPTTALDMVTQAQVIRLINRLRRRMGLALVFISHDPSILAQVCDRIGIMYAGKMVEIGNTRDVLLKPRHPYTRALLAAFPDIGGPRRTLSGLPGSPPDLVDPPQGCRLQERCPEARPLCASEEPTVVFVSPGHSVACHLVAERC